VIGTGFGGAVAACRLAQAGKRVCILERGRRYDPADFPRPATRPDNLPQTARWAWAIDRGLWDVKDLQGTLTAQAAGYGGGSLVYANVHLRAPAEVFEKDWPTGYTRAELDPYYDVVAAVLRVQPLPQRLQPPSPVPGPLPKAEAMRGAAAELGRDRWFFKPPLAINFKKCEMRAECIAGCPVAAKNTLDLNYLQVAERAPTTDIRTLAEVTEIAEEVDAYTVTYHDHISGEDKVTVRGKSVFLCAGAVNSTHLLFRSIDRLPNVSRATRKQLGRRFYGNGDAIAMMYDTEGAPVPTLGPTITTTLLYNNGAGRLRDAPREWFVLQDGGYPKWFEPIMGLFRGDFWLERNLVERTSRRVDAAEVARVAAEDAKKLGDQISNMGRSMLYLLDARSTIRDAVRDPRVRSLHALGLGGVLPPQISEKLLPDLHQFVSNREIEEAATVSFATLNEVGRRMIAACYPTLAVKLGQRAAKPYVLPSTLEMLHEHVFNAPRGADPFTTAVLWPLAVREAERLFLGRRPDDHAFLMLGVGIDPAPGYLYVDDDGRLLAFWEVATNVQLSSAQERLMHDVSNALGGEMRLNPDASARQRSVTVHCLGGCAMADREDKGVTDSNGKVWGTRALYVLDGAAMPTSLGTNPSATIAAIAERNVRKALADPASPIFTPTPVPLDPPLPGGSSLDQIRSELGQTPAVLDPIAAISDVAPAPRSPALGLRFDEIMEGFYVSGGDQLPIRVALRATIEDLNAFLVNPERVADISGSASITSLAGTRASYAATGTLELLRRVDAIEPLDELLRRGPSLLSRVRPTFARSFLDRDEKKAHADLEALVEQIRKTPHRYEMLYSLTLKGPDGSWDFKGVKKIYGGPGIAVWTQTTTLDVTLCDPTNTQHKGTMHVHLGDFLKTQLPSFTVTGTDDDVRIAWAFGRFFRFFFGTLRQVYLPHAQLLDPFGDQGV